MSVDQYLSRRYDRKNYHCLHFVAEVWQAETGEDVNERLEVLLGAVAGGGKRHSLQRQHVRAFTRLRGPVSPCFALMERPGFEPHVGLYIRGRILHITERGVEFFPPSLAARNFTSVKYYK